MLDVFWPRLQRPPKRNIAVATYKGKAKQKILLDTAAKFWARGVPWEEAFKTAQTVRKKTEERLKAGKHK